jgi:uncharacterized protein with HEPN domain
MRRDLVAAASPITVNWYASDLRERHPLVPWAKAKGMRNVVVHHYFGVAWDEVWRTATLDIPALRRQIAAVLGAEFPDSNATLES